MVKTEGFGADLKASVGVEPNKPPTTGWKFENRTLFSPDFEFDPSLTCSIIAPSPPCCLTVSLTGAAKKAQGKCEGEYKITELTSRGKPVKASDVKIIDGKDCLLSLSGFQTGRLR